MLHKVNPHNLRTGIIRNWETRWDGNTSAKSVSLNGSRFNNLEICCDTTIFETKKVKVGAVVKKMKKR